jgi:hypothetical protein
LDLKEKIKIRLQVYSELINKPEDEALYYALGLAKMFFELQKRFEQQKDLKLNFVKADFSLELKLEQQKINKSLYYQKNKTYINNKRKTLKLIKKGT